MSGFAEVCRCDRSACVIREVVEELVDDGLIPDCNETIITNQGLIQNWSNVV